MGAPSGTVYTTTEIISVNEGEPVSELSASRSDFVAMKKAIEASDLMIRSGKMSYLPKLNAFGAYQLNDSRLLGFGAGAYLAGIRLSWDIFKGNTTKNNIATQTLERNKLNTQLEQQKEQSNTELVKAIRDLSDTQFEINQYTKAIEQASESLRILQNRYEQGLVNTTDIMMATSQLSQQKLSLAQAVYNKNLTGAYLQFITTSTHQ
jgi:outer membrane protein TolC